MNSQQPRASVFLSSNFLVEVDGEKRRFPLRQRICEQAPSLPVDLWAFELLPDVSKFQEEDADLIIDKCFAGIKKCELFVFLLSKRHGTGAKYIANRVHSSYLELELFAAAMLRKPILILNQRGVEPDQTLRNTLDLLQRTFPRDKFVTADENVLFERFMYECKRLECAHMATEPILFRLADWLSRWRTHASYREELASPVLRFMDGGMQAERRADPGRASELLAQVASGIRKRGNESVPMPHGAALFRIWAAMRELMDESGRTLADPQLAGLWDRALGSWSSHSSWFGLHGHLWMGPLAAVQSQIDLRRSLSANPAFRANNDVREPVGARASAIYSIAQRMYSWRQKMRQFRMSEDLATQAIAQNPEGSPGALSIRGRAALRLAQLGQVWKVWQAEADFREGLRLREQMGESEATLAEGFLDLGLCLAYSLRPRAGLDLLQKGISLLRSDISPNATTRLARIEAAVP